jgi:hypothetical protein
VVRGREDLVDRPLLAHPSAVHDRDAIGDLPHDRQIIGNEQVRQAELALEIAEEVQDRRAHRDVQRRHRLIAHDEAGSAAKAHAIRPLLLATRELVRVPGRVAGREAHRGQRIVSYSRTLTCTASHGWWVS